MSKHNNTTERTQERPIKKNKKKIKKTYIHQIFPDKMDNNGEVLGGKNSAQA